MALYSNLLQVTPTFEGQVVYTTPNVVAALVGLVIAVAAWLIVGLMKEAVATMKSREEKMDTILEEYGKKLTNLEKNDAIREYAATVIDARIFKLETWKEEHTKEHS